MDFFDAVATIECQVCHQANGVELPGSPTDDSIARCRACGADFGRWGDIKDAAARIIATRTLLRRVLSGSVFWSVRGPPPRQSLINKRGLRRGRTGRIGHFVDASWWWC